MKPFTLNLETPLGEGRWRVGNRNLDEVILSLQNAGKPLSETILHLERLKWREAHPSPRASAVRLSKQKTIDDLKAGMEAGIFTRDYSAKWWFDAVKLGLKEEG